MSDDRLRELRELSEKATAGPWSTKVKESFWGIEQPHEKGKDSRVAYVYGSFADKTTEEATANTEFIVACVNYVRELLAAPASPESAVEALVAKARAQAFEEAAQVIDEEIRLRESVDIDHMRPIDELAVAIRALAAKGARGSSEDQ